MNNRRIYILVGLVVVLLLVLALLFKGGNKRYNWEETYKMDSTQPYGTSIITGLLKDVAGGEELAVIRDSLGNNLALDLDSTHNYVFVGQGMHMNSSDVDHLLDFVNRGNNAFISCKIIPYDLMFYVYYEECDSNAIWNGLDRYQDSTVTLNFQHESLRSREPYVYKYIGESGVSEQGWSYFDSIYFCDKQWSLIELGRMNDSLINFARIAYGDGFFYLHSTPSAFSNVQMLDETGFAYANAAFSHLLPGKIYWDEYSRVSERTARMLENRSNPSQRTLSAESPLQYILSQPPLTWAWYLLLATGLLYLFLRTKRRQRVIPVLESNKNTSLEFLSTIGRLYFLQNNHRQLCLQKIKLFQNHVRHRYQLQGRDMDESFIERLALRTEVSREELTKIITMSKNIENSTFVSENTLTNFHQLLDHFYKTAKQTYMDIDEINENEESTQEPTSEESAPEPMPQEDEFVPPTPPEQQRWQQNRLDLTKVQLATQRIKEELNKVIIGQQEYMDLLLAALFAGGHVLVEGVPGIAKTLTAKLIARTLDVGFSRIQFTPDLMPSDVIGTTVFNLRSSEFSFKSGPVFSNLVLIDEINRAPAKTQAALFEVMEEYQVTVDGTTYKMEFPFFVIATQNPIEQEGTYKLPEAQLDRFLVKINLEYPALDEEKAILRRFRNDFKVGQLEDVKTVFTAEEVRECQNLVEQIYIKDELLDYIAAIVHNTRNNGDLFLGASPRASLAIMRMAKAIAATSGRDFVTPEDIQYVAYPVLNHRVILTPEREMEGLYTRDVIQDIIKKIEVPRQIFGVQSLVGREFRECARLVILQILLEGRCCKHLPSEKSVFGSSVVKKIHKS